MPSSSSSQSIRQSFTLDGSDALEQQLATLCERICRAVLSIVGPPKLEALVLGGGYGRGQGGVLQTEVGEAPYNDLEFYVFLRGNPLLNARRYGDCFRQLERELSPGAGLHVEFKVDSSDKLRLSQVSIFSYDLVSGHRICFGNKTVFNGCEAHADPANIPPSEATRLLLNRCSGLLLAKELLLKSSLSPQESDFVGRNLAKVQLALGDALLALKGEYHWDCLERARRLAALRQAGFPAVLQPVFRHHAAGVRFKLHPSRQAKNLQCFKDEHRELTDLALEEWLWIENQRLETNFSDFRQYAFSRVDKCSGRGLWRNVLLNLRTFGARSTFHRTVACYPRQRLLNSLPLLLSDTGLLAEGDTRRYLQDQLHTRAQDWTGLVAAYKQLWSCYG